MKKLFAQIVKFGIFASRRKRKRKKDGKEKPVRAGFSARSTH